MKKLLIPILSLFILSCELVIDVPTPKFDPQLVILGTFSSDSGFSVIVGRDYYILDTAQLHTLDGARVTLFEDGNQVDVLEERWVYGHNNEGEGNEYYYHTDYLAKAGSTYEIQVEKEGYKTATASSTFLDRQLDVIVKKDSAIINEFGEEYKTYTINIELNDQQGENFYGLDVFEETYNPTFYFDIETETYDYDSIIHIDTAIYRTWVEPNHPLFDNQEWWGERIIFDDNTFDGRTFTFDLGLNTYYASDDLYPEPSYYIDVYQLTEEYFYFLRSIYKQDYNEGDPFAEPVGVYTNVENGLGVFAGYSKQRIKVE